MPTNTHLHMKGDKTFSRPNKADTPSNTYLRPHAKHQRPPPHERKQDHFKAQEDTPSRRRQDHFKAQASTNQHPPPHEARQETISRPKKEDTPTNTHLHIKRDKTISRRTHQPTSARLHMKRDKTILRPKKADQSTN